MCRVTENLAVRCFFRLNANLTYCAVTANPWSSAAPKLDNAMFALPKESDGERETRFVKNGKGVTGGYGERGGGGAM